MYYRNNWKIYAFLGFHGQFHVRICVIISMCITVNRVVHKQPDYYKKIAFEIDI